MTSTTLHRYPFDPNAALSPVEVGLNDALMVLTKPRLLELAAEFNVALPGGTKTKAVLADAIRRAGFALIPGPSQDFPSGPPRTLQPEGRLEERTPRPFRTQSLEPSTGVP